MRDGPILPTLLGMTLPNLVALGSAALITIAETAYVGQLGIAALGGVALVFPVIMLMQMLSAGAMGGAISGAVSRALGAGDSDRAEALARAAALIAGIAGLGLALMLWLAGPALFRLLGGSGATLQAAIDYCNVAAFAIVAIWLTNCLASVLRGAGDMRTPAAIQLGAGAVQIIVGGTLGLGLFGLPRLGVSGVALGQLVAFWLATAVLLYRLGGNRSRIALHPGGEWPSGSCFSAILRVGLMAALSPLQSVATVLILTAMIARFGPEALAGFGIGVRLEFLLIPVAFSVGVACLPMVGTAIGAGNLARARSVAWTAGGLSAAALALVGLIFGLFPSLWVDLFASELGTSGCLLSGPRSAGNCRHHMQPRRMNPDRAGILLCLHNKQATSLSRNAGTRPCRRSGSTSDSRTPLCRYAPRNNHRLLEARRQLPRLRPRHATLPLQGWAGF